MGYDKYDLDWKVHGSNKSTSEKSSASDALLAGIGKGWSQNKQPQQNDELLDTSTNVSQPEKLTVQITEARFIPDENTTFVKECKIEIQAKGDPKFAEVTLYANYDDEVYDLQVSKKVALVNGKVESSLPLEYVEAFYHEYLCNGNKDATVDYFFKATCQGAVEKKSDLLRMPIQSGSNELVLKYPLVRLKKLISSISKTVSCYWFGSIFGRAIPSSIFNSLHDEICNDLVPIPKCIVVADDNTKLQGHAGAFDEDEECIYVKKSIVDDQSEHESLAIVLCEEYGHNLEKTLRKKITFDFESPGDEGAIFARHLLVTEQYDEGTVLLCINKSNQQEIFFERSKIGEILDSLLPEDMIQWEHQSRQLSFSSIFVIDDVVEYEMPGFDLIAIEDTGSIKKGDSVKITDWKRQAIEIMVTDSTGSVQTVKTYYFEPKQDPARKLIYYSVGLAKLRNIIANAEKKIEQHKSTKKNPPTKLWSDELSRLESLDEKRKIHYSQMLAREIMYNRFDNSFIQWVDHYNSLLKPKKLLSADIVKSMAFQEGRMGTSGRYFMKPPHTWDFTTEHPIMSRFNLIQALDSGLQQQFLIIEEMDPVFFNSEVMSDGRKMSDLKRFAIWKGLKFPDPSLIPPDVALMQEAIEKFARKWASSHGQTIDGTKMGLYTEYDFWIRSAVRWLFEKYLNTVKSSNWQAAVKRYNGGGNKANNYAIAVLKRISDASGGTLFIGNK